MKVIELTQDQVALVSDHRYEELNQYKWHAWWSEQTQSFYARRNETLPDGRQRVVLMHRQIMGEPKGLLVDHKNHNTLDNQDDNLRTVNRFQSGWNTRAHRDGKLGERNITTFPNGRYGVQIMAKGVRHQKSFLDLEEARGFRDCMQAKLHGEYAYGVGL